MTMTDAHDTQRRLDRLEVRLRRSQRITLALGTLALTGIAAAFTPRSDRVRFTEIDAERINIVESDGRLRLVISNRERSPTPMVRGQEFGGSAGRRPGLISYNDELTENGGFIWGGGRNPDGTYWAEQSLTFDQYEQDQIIALQYIDANGVRRHGLQILDRNERSMLEQHTAWLRVDSIPPGPARDSAIARFREEYPVAQRLYVGRDRSRAASVVLGDPEGRTRLRLRVDSTGQASIQFLDEEGRVTRELAGR